MLTQTKKICCGVDIFTGPSNETAPGLLDSRPIWFRNLHTNSRARVPAIIQDLPSSFPLSMGAAVYTTSDICPCGMPVSFHVRRNNAHNCFMVLEGRSYMRLGRLCFGFFHPGQDKEQNPSYIARAFLAGRGKPILLVPFRGPKDHGAVSNSRASLVNFEDDTSEETPQMLKAKDAFFEQMFR